VIYGEPRLVRVTRVVVALSVATVLAALTWVWGQAVWKFSASPEGALKTALAMFAFVALVCVFGLERRPGRLRRVVAFALPVVFPGCGSCATEAVDFNPGGGVNFAFENNTPHNASSGVAVLLLGAVIIGLCALVPLRAADRAGGTSELGRVWVLTGSWVIGSAFAIALLAVAVPLLIGQHLILLAALGVTLVLIGVVQERPTSLRRAVVGGVLVIAGAAGAWVLARRTTVGRCEAVSPGAVMWAVAKPSREYDARGATLERVTCKSAFQFTDETTSFLVGRAASGRELDRRELFATIVGPPALKARAACELLLPSDCDGVLDQQALNYTRWAGTPAAAPLEANGKLTFFGYKDNYIYGRGTTLGMMHEPLRATVDLHTLAVAVEHTN
jgi:hypothetical protein